MTMRARGNKPDTSAGPIRRALRYASYDWTRDMSKPKRRMTWAAILLQGYTIYCVLMWVLGVPKAALGYILVLPRGLPSYVLAWFLYTIGWYVINGMLASEFGERYVKHRFYSGAGEGRLSRVVEFT